MTGIVRKICVGAASVVALPVFAATHMRDNAVGNAELFSAIHEGARSRVAAALDAGASPNAISEEGTPALLDAALYDDAAVVRLLVNRGANPNARAKDGATALILAAGDLAKVKALVEKGADVNAKSTLGRTPLLVAVAQRDSFAIATYLIGHGADVNARDNSGDFITRGSGSTALMLAVRSGDNRTVEQLMAKGVDVNVAMTTGGTALTEAVSVRNVEAVRMLIEHGTKVNLVFGPIQMTPLIWASFQECPEIVRMLIKAGAEVNAKDALGSTALVWASMSERDDAETVAALLGAGAAVNVKTAMGETPLTWAKRRGATEIVHLLEDKSEGGEKNANR
jgi:ankyrin repeat protein